MTYQLGQLLAHEEATFVLSKGACVYCGVPLATWTIDHVIPKSRGGLDGIRNWVCCCSGCNGAKGDYLPSRLAANVRAAKKLQAVTNTNNSWPPKKKLRCGELWVTPKGFWLFKKRFETAYKQKFSDQIEREKSRLGKVAGRLRHLLQSKWTVRAKWDRKSGQIACKIVKT